MQHELAEYIFRVLWRRRPITSSRTPRVRREMDSHAVVGEEWSLIGTTVRTVV